MLALLIWGFSREVKNLLKEEQVDSLKELTSLHPFSLVFPISDKVVLIELVVKDSTTVKFDNRMSDDIEVHVLCCNWKSMESRFYTICRSTTAQMAHFSFPYYFTIPNSEFRIPKFALRISEFGIVKYI